MGGDKKLGEGEDMKFGREGGKVPEVSLKKDVGEERERGRGLE